jgi:5-(carboxyamino)imidazole ribonucleotide mutase
VFWKQIKVASDLPCPYRSYKILPGWSENMDNNSGEPRPLVGIIMGSISDLDTMRDAANILDPFEIPYELRIVSAHRTPDLMIEYAATAAGRGLEVIIAGAGGAAHLPGMTAALTVLPVIGVPVQTKTLQGLDSLLSIVQMPAGVPVATMAIGNAKNAGLMAARILAIKYPTIATKLRQYAETVANEVKSIKI